MNSIHRLCLAVVGLAYAIAATAADPAIALRELAERINSSQPPMIVDVRTTAEYRGGHVPGAINIAYDELAARWPALNANRDVEIVLYCGTGRRAGIAQQTLEGLGFHHTRLLEGSFSAWKQAALPVVKEHD